MTCSHSRGFSPGNCPTDRIGPCWPAARDRPRALALGVLLAGPRALALGVLSAGIAGCTGNEASGILGGTALSELSALSQGQPAICDPPPTAAAAVSASTVTARADGYGYLNLDATDSTAPVRGELSFTWVDNGKEIAAGEYIYVRLSEGTHDVTLLVRDFCGNEAADTIRVTVQPPSQSQ